MYKNKKFNQIIKEICIEENIQCQELSDDWVIKLTKDNTNKFIVGYKFDLNTQAVSEICNDKFALYAVLESEKIPVIKYNILFKNEEKKLEHYFRLYNENVVLKPNNGTCGNNVLHICELNELKEEYQRLIKNHYSVSICPFYEIESEYRVIYLPNLQYTYKKVKPIIIGDGIRSIKDLLIEFNPSYFSNDDNFNNDKIDINYVPKINEKIEYEWRFNLSKGARIDTVDDEERKKLLDIVKQILDKIDLKFVSIDIVKLSNGEFRIMEINSGVMMENLINLEKNGYEVAKKIYKEAIDNMFIKTVSREHKLLFDIKANPFYSKK